MSTQQLMMSKLEPFIDPTTGQPFVSTWVEQPNSLDILYMGDSLEKSKVPSSNIVYKILESLLMMSLISEDITLDQLLDRAVWRQPVIDVVVEEPVIEEPVIEEPIIEEPIIEEPIIEEPIIEEPGAANE